MAKKSQKFIVAKSITEYASKDEAAAALVEAEDDGLILVIGNVVPFKIETNPRLVFESAPKKERKARAPRGDKAAAAPAVAPEVVDKVKAVIAQPKKIGEIVTESGLDKEVVSAALAAMGAVKNNKGRGTTYTYVPGATTTVPPPPLAPSA